MNLKSIIGTVCICVAMFYLKAAGAAITHLEAHLDGLQEVPPNQSPGTGFASVTLEELDETSFLLSWDVTWSGLSGPAIAMHFHGPAEPGVNAPPVVDIGAISGLMSPSIGSDMINGSQAGELLEGLWYINIHTAEFPGGEIRGQVNVIPVPAAVWLFGSGLVGLIGLARRRAA